MSYVADFRKRPCFSCRIFSRPIKHQIEKSGPQGSCKTGYFPSLKKKRYKFKKCVPRHVQKFYSRLKKLFQHKWRRSKFFMNANVRFDPVLALLNSTVTYMRLSLQKRALSHQVLLLGTVMFETIICNFSSCLIDKFYRFLLSSVKGFLIHRKYFFESRK